MTRYSAPSFIKAGCYLEAKSYTAGTNDSAALGIAGFGQFLGIVNVGVSAATGDVSVSIIHADTAAGSYTVATKADGTTPLTAAVVADTVGDQAQYLLSCRTDLLKPFVKIRVVTADAASILGTSGIAYDPHDSANAEGDSGFAVLGD